MAKRKTKITTPAYPKTKPRAEALPGMEDHAIAPLEKVAEEYAGIRDARMDLTQQEIDLKGRALKLMKQYKKTEYHHDGISITVIAGEESIKVKVQKHTDDTDAEAGDGVMVD